MMPRLTPVLLCLLSIFSLVLGLGENVKLQTVPDALKNTDLAGGTWYQEIAASSAADMTDVALQNAAKTAWEASAKLAGSKRKTPAVMVALFVPNKGVVMASTIKTDGVPKPSAQTCRMVKWDHRSSWNCAEPNSVSIAQQQGWIAGTESTDIPKGTKMAIYGKPGKTAGFQGPCEENAAGVSGCTRFISEHKIKIVNPTGGASTSKRAVDFVA